MTVFVLAQITITDRAPYNRYQARFMDVLIKYGGRILAADEHPKVIEGKWDREKVILFSFKDEPSFTTWMNSPEYQEISKDRVAGSNGVVLLLKGVG